MISVAHGVYYKCTLGVPGWTSRFALLSTCLIQVPALRPSFPDNNISTGTSAVFASRVKLANENSLDRAHLQLGLIRLEKGPGQ